MRRVILAVTGSIAWTALVCGILLQTAQAQETVVEDPPERALRLGYRQGEVSMQEADSTEWTTATLNRPLSIGDRLWADGGSRAEVQAGSATIHLDEYSGLEVVDLGSDRLGLLLREGAINVHVREVGRSQTLVIDTPNTLVSLLEPGEYRIEAAPSGDTTVVKVREGTGSVTSPTGSSRTYTVEAGREGRFTGMDALSADIFAVGRRTAFDNWSRDREDRASRLPATRYVSREVIGYEDLDAHGDWDSHAEYGYVWYPRVVAAGWAPYRHGHWVWVRPWGWTWVDSAPWGFAPFHYGRWAHVRGRWAWVPGPRHVRPVYAPALVAWVGSPTLSLSMSFGSGIGWFPLGPREVYVPWYRTSRDYVTRVNVTNTVIVNNTYITNVYESRGRGERYVHRGRGDAVTLVSREDFTRGRPVDRHRVRWTDGDAGTIEANPFEPERRSPDRTFVRSARPERAERPRDAAPDRPERRITGRTDRPASEARTTRPATREEANRLNRVTGEGNRPGSAPRLRDDPGRGETRPLVRSADPERSRPSAGDRRSGSSPEVREFRRDALPRTGAAVPQRPERSERAPRSSQRPVEPREDARQGGRASSPPANIVSGERSSPRARQERESQPSGAPGRRSLAPQGQKEEDERPRGRSREGREN